MGPDVVMKALGIFEAFVLIVFIDIFPVCFRGGILLTDEIQVERSRRPEIPPVAAPAIIRRRTDAGFPGIVQDIPEDRQQVKIVFHRFAQVAALEEVAGPAVFLVIVK